MQTYEIKVLDRTEHIVFDTLPETSQEFVINYGLKQLLNDSHVSGKDDDERHALLDKKLDKLFEGTLSIRESSGGDPVAVELTKLAHNTVKKHIVEKLKLSVKDVSKADYNVLMKKARANEKLQDQARANVVALDAAEIEL